MEYDMIPLRGLRRTERVLAKHGIAVRRTRVAISSSRPGHGFALSRSGVIDLDSLEWSVLARSRRRAFRAACGYVSCRDGRARLGEDDHATLTKVWISTAPKPADARRAAEVLHRLGWSLVPIRLEVLA